MDDSQTLGQSKACTGREWMVFDDIDVLKEAVDMGEDWFLQNCFSHDATYNNNHGHQEHNID
jgi:hypothetical protein